MESIVSQHLRDMGTSIIDLMMLHRERSGFLHDTVEKFQSFTNELRARSEVMNDRIREMEPLVHCLHNGLHMAIQNPRLDLRVLMTEVQEASARVVSASQEVQALIVAWQGQDNAPQGVQGGGGVGGVENGDPQTPSSGRGLSIP